MDRRATLPRCTFMVIAGFVLTMALLAHAQTPQTQTSQPSAIDWDYAKQLYNRSSRGDALNTEEQAYLNRAKEAHQRSASQKPDGGPRPGGVRSPAPTTQYTTMPGMTPLTEITGNDRYKNQAGGLYGDGQNDPPPAQQQAAGKALAQIAPLDADGKPSPDGRIVLMSIGMSNTTNEFSRFKQIADGDQAKSPRLIIVDGAQGGKDSAAWAQGLSATPWQVAQQRLQSAGATEQQVQVVWIKQALMGQGQYGEFPAHAQRLKKDLGEIARLAKEHYPNLRIAYLSSRIYAGYANTPLNPEPYAYEGAFSVRWLIQDQIKGDSDLNWDANQGKVVAPVLLWGPYLWGNGVAPRKADGMVWCRDDLSTDGTHPSTSGRQKVADLLLSFFITNEYAKSWFVGK